MKAYTRYNNPALFDKMQLLMPVEVSKGEGFNNWRDAATYLEWVIEKRDRLAINIDIDCFVTDWAVLQEMIADFNAGEYTHAGIPDAGVMQGRSNLSWVVMNPFFNLFNSFKIYNRAVGYSWSSIRRTGFKREWYFDRPAFVNEYEQCMWEPFNGFFNWLYEWGKPMWLTGDLHPDGVSTIIKYNGKPFALHSWYSREYDHNEEQRKRIDELYQEALNIRT